MRQSQSLYYVNRFIFFFLLQNTGYCLLFLHQKDFYKLLHCIYHCIDARNSNHTHQSVFPLAITTKCASIPLIFCWVLSLIILCPIFAVSGAADTLSYIIFSHLYFSILSLLNCLRPQKHCDFSFRVNVCFQASFKEETVINCSLK